MKIGIVGKANVGKSTFFKALTLADILIANYPFATIKPNIGCAYVRVKAVCTEFGIQCTPRFGKCENGIRYVPVEVLDVAGLVPGAHEGKGMGNQFLDDLRQADALIHIVDIAGTTNEKGEPVEPGSYDPLNDIRWLDIELDMWYYGILKKGWERFSRMVQQDKTKISRELAKQLSGLNVKEEHVEKAIKELKLDPNKPTEWTEDQLKALASKIRKETKPMIIVANKADISTAAENIERAKKEFPDYKIIPASAESELALKEADKKGLIKYLPGDAKFEIIGEMSEQQKKALDFIQKNVLDKLNGTGVQEAIDSAVFDELKYIAVFPGGSNFKDSQGRIMPDCFLMPPGSTAYDFAEKLHTDIAKGFIGAIDVKTKRKIGRDHELKNRDVIEILTKS
ncbi:redox-regulated ATPase YchF [Candidatus Woesearchaeota archaeon]|nr:redox-regulated ATPase YchF [Candidatus Woesearchaeota archaeon]